MGRMPFTSVWIGFMTRTSRIRQMKVGFQYTEDKMPFSAS